MQPLIVVVGPTAVGKSAIGIKLAQAVDGEIISGDSIQVYRELDIGSAKPSKFEQKIAPHHLIDFLEPDEDFTAAKFKELASSLIEDIKIKNHVPIIVGGTGLYIRSLLDSFNFSHIGSEDIRKKWIVYKEKHGNDALHKELFMRDPQSAERLHPNDIYRVIRALEIFELTGTALSSQRESMDRIYPALEGVIYIGLTAPREFIYNRINERCFSMLENGLLEETLNLIQQGYSKKIKSLQSIGYKHSLWYLYGFVNKAEMMRLFQRDTRHFAKRQLTWFRRDPRITWYDVTQVSTTKILDDIISTCRAYQTRVE